MGVPRFSGGRQLNGGSMSFETYLNQINLLYPYAGDMYTKYLKLINEFDSNQMKRLIEVGEYETANSLFTSKLLVFAKLKETNVELFNSFVDAFGIREALEIIFDIGSMTLDEMLLFVSEQYPDDVATYEAAIQLIRDFELAEFMRFMGITADDILANNENYIYFIDSLLNRFNGSVATFNELTENGNVLGLLNAEQITYVNTSMEENLHRFMMTLMFNETPHIEKSPSILNFISSYFKNNVQMMNGYGYVFSDILSQYQYMNLDYLELLSDETLKDLFIIQNNIQFFQANFNQMRIAMGHLDARISLPENWDLYDVGANTSIDSLLRPIVDRLIDTGEFVFTDAFSELFKYLTEQSMYENIRLLEQSDKLTEPHKTQVMNTTALLISQNIYAFNEYGLSKGYLGSDTFATFFMQLAGHHQGYDKWGIKGGVMCTSDTGVHADFICANISRLISGHGSNTINQMVGNTELQYFFDDLFTNHPIAYSGIKSMMDSAKTLPV